MFTLTFMSFIKDLKALLLILFGIWPPLANKLTDLQYKVSIKLIFENVVSTYLYIKYFSKIIWISFYYKAYDLLRFAIKLDLD